MLEEDDRWRQMLPNLTVLYVFLRLTTLQLQQGNRTQSKLQQYCGPERLEQSVGCESVCLSVCPDDNF